MSHNRLTLQQNEIAAIEKLIVDTQFRIHQLMEQHGVTRAELAKKLGCSKSRVTQFFGDRPNVTLETLARIFYALDDECRVTSDAIEAILAKLNRDLNESPKKEYFWNISELSEIFADAKPVRSDNVALVCARAEAMLGNDEATFGFSSSIDYTLHSAEKLLRAGKTRSAMRAHDDIAGGVLSDIRFSL